MRAIPLPWYKQPSHLCPRLGTADPHLSHASAHFRSVKAFTDSTVGLYITARVCMQVAFF